MDTLRRLRRNEGLTMAELARKVGVSMHSVFRWENGMSSPNAKEILILANVLNTTPNDLLGITKEEAE